MVVAARPVLVRALDGRVDPRAAEDPPGAIADLLVVDTNPLNDLSVLAGQGERLLAIMKEGTFVKDELGA